MIWQDYVLSFIGFAFAATLVPSILKKDAKPAVSTSLLTGIGVTGVAITVATLSLYLAAIGNMCSAVCWYILLYQRIRSSRQGSKKGDSNVHHARRRFPRFR